jgi:predicted nucleic acid-binding Zn ribbon protein
MDEDMKLIRNGEEENIYNYYCDDCQEDFYIDRALEPAIVHCPHCGSSGEVSINSKHLDELYE